jgi:hypothetical protein
MEATQRMLKSRPRGPSLPSQAFLDVTLDRRFPEALVGGVDGEFLGVGRNLHVRVGQEEFADFAIQGEAVDAVAGGQHQHGG